MAFLFLLSLFLLPLLHLRSVDAGCCCCCCPSCCCKPIIIKLPPPPVKLCPCCCGCCCKPCCCCCPCCCGGGGGRKRRSVIDLMAKKFSDVLLPQLNQDAIIPAMGGGCGGQQTLSALAPLHSLCSQIPPAQRGPACQQITSQQFPLSQNIFNQQPTGTMVGPNNGGGSNGEFDCQCSNCGGCNGGQCSNCGPSPSQHNSGCQAGAGVPSLCPGNQQMPGGNVFRPVNGDLDGSQAFNFAQNFAPSPCGGGNGGGRKKRALLLLRKFMKEPTISDNENDERKAAKREAKNQQQLVFRNNLEFVVRQSPQNL